MNYMLNVSDLIKTQGVFILIKQIVLRIYRNQLD